MHLCSNTVDEAGSATIVLLDDVDDGVGFRICRIKVVVVDVELGVGVSLAGGLERYLDKGL